MKPNRVSKNRSRRSRPLGAAALLVLSLLLALLTGGCAAEPLEIIGTYTDQYDSTHTITAAEWNDGYSLFEILYYSNDNDWLIAQNDAGNDYYADLYSRFNWTTYLSDLYYCQATFAEASAADAQAAAAPDATDPTALESCGTFNWTRLDPQ